MTATVHPIHPQRSRATEQSLLVVDDPAVRWALDAAIVDAVLETASWRGAPAIDVRAHLGTPDDGERAAARVVVVRAPGGALPLLVRGPIRLCAVATADLFEVPELVRTAGAPAALHGVVLTGPLAPLFVVVAERLRELTTPTARSRLQ